jgi:hypothetical protein
MLTNAIVIITAPAAIINQPIILTGNEILYNNSEDVRIAITNPTAQSGIPVTSLRMIVMKVPVFLPHFSENVVVKALARFDIKPGIRIIRNQYICPSFLFCWRNKM